MPPHLLLFCLTPHLSHTRQAFDEHLNMVLGEAEETHTVAERDADTGEVLTRSTKRSLPMVFVRGDMVILVSPPLRV